MGRGLITKLQASLNSFCGVLSHGRNYRLRRRMFLEENDFGEWVKFDDEVLKCVVRKNFL